MIDFKSVIKNVFIFFSFFPFVGPNIGSDMQPFALVAAVFLLIIYRRIVIPYKIWIYSSILIIALISVYSVVYVPLLDVIKRLFSYISLIMIYVASYTVYNKENFFDFEKKSKIYNCIWALVGGVQYYFINDFLTFLVPLSRTTESRGVCSLASEPSFYGYMCFLFFVFALSYKKHKIIFCLLSFIQTIFFAQSTVALLYFVVFAIWYAIFKIIELNPKQICYYIITIGCAVFFIYSWIQKNEDSRMGFLIMQMVSDPSYLLVTDASVQSRYNSIEKSFSEGGIPTPIGLGGGLLHSGFGSVFYELGFFSFFLFIPIWKSIYNGYRNKTLGKTMMITISFCMLSAIQLSLPLAALYYGICAANNQK